MAFGKLERWSLRGVRNKQMNAGRFLRQNFVAHESGEAMLVCHRAREFDVGTAVYTRLMSATQLRQALGLGPAP